MIFARKSLIWIGTLYALFIANIAYADTISVGSFCIEGVTSRTLPDSRIDVENASWIASDYSYQVSATGGATASIVVFSKSVTIDPTVLPTCRNTKAAAAAQGVSVVLEGKLRQLAVRIYHRVAGSTSNSFLILPDSFVATIGNVTSGYSTIAGGKLDLAGSRAWIGNPNQLNIGGGGMTGVLRVESWDRTLQNAVFRTPAGDVFRQTLRALPSGNTTIDIDSATGLAALWNADLAAQNSSITATRLDGEMAIFNGVALKSKRLLLKVRTGKVALAFDDNSGTAASGVLGNGPLTTQLGSTSFTSKQAEAPATQDVARIDLRPLVFTDLAFQSGPSKMLYAQAVLFDGPVKAQFASFNMARVKGAADFTTPQTPTLAYALPQGAVPSARVELEGSAGQLNIKGAINTTQLVVGGAGFTVPAVLSFAKGPADLAIDIPINVHVGPVGGKVTFKDSKNVVMLSANLGRFDLAGTLHIDVSDVAQSRLEVADGNLAFQMDAAISRTAYLAGSTPELAKLGVSAVNKSALVVGRTGSSGAIDIQTSILALGQPLFDIGTKGKPAHIKLSLDATGGATLRYDLARNAARIVEGNFALANTSINSPDAGFTADIGGVLIEQPDLQLKSLAIVFHNGDPTGHVSGGGFSFNGGAVRNASDKGVAFNGSIVAPLAFDTIDGRVVLDSDHIGLVDLSIRKLSFAVKAQRVVFDKSMQLRDAALRLSADEVRSVNGQTDAGQPANGTYLTNFRVQADGALDIGGNVHLANQPRINGLDVTVNGNVEALDGGGRASLDGFLGTLDSALDTGFKCDGGDTLQVPMQVHLATGPSALTIEVAGGNFKTSGSFAGFIADMHSTAQESQCLSDHKTYHNDPVYASMTGWCPTWRHPGRTCTWKTIVVPAITIGYRVKASIWALHAGIAMSNPRVVISNGGVSVCNVGAARLVAPAIIAGYVPQFDDNGLIAKAVNVIVEGIGVTVESSIANSLLNVGSVLITDPILNAGGSGICVLKGEYRL